MNKSIKKIADLAVSCQSILVKVYNADNDALMYSMEYRLNGNGGKTTKIAGTDKKTFRSALEFIQDCAEKRFSIDMETAFGQWCSINC